MVKDVSKKVLLVQCILEHRLNVANLWVQIKQFIVGMYLPQLL